MICAHVTHEFVLDWYTVGAAHVVHVVPFQNDPDEHPTHAVPFHRGVEMLMSRHKVHTLFTAASGHVPHELVCIFQAVPLGHGPHVVPDTTGFVDGHLETHVFEAGSQYGY